MRASVGFIFFMLFLAGLAFVNLRGMKDASESSITSAADLAGTAWRATHIGEMRLQDDVEIVIQFDSDTSVSGNSGCNRFFGDFEFVDDSLAIGPLGSTRMACPEPANSFELSFLQALDEARSVTRVDSRLAMRNSKNVVVARFTTASISDAEE